MKYIQLFETYKIKVDKLGRAIIHPNMKKYKEGDIVVYKNPTSKKRKIGIMLDTIFMNKFIINPLNGKSDGQVFFGGEEIPASYVFRLAKDFEIDTIKYNL